MQYMYEKSHTAFQHFAFQQGLVMVSRQIMFLLLVMCIWQIPLSGEERTRDPSAVSLINPGQGAIAPSAIDLSVKTGQVTGIWSVEWILREDIGLVVVSWDGMHLVTSGQSGVSLYDIGQQRHVQTVSSGSSSGRGMTNIAAVSSDGDRFLSGVGLISNVINLWDGRTGQRLHYFGRFKNAVTLAGFHPHKPLIVTGAGDIQVWNADTYEEVARYPLEAGEYAQAITWHEERLLIASVSRESGLVMETLIRIYDLEHQQELSRFIPTRAYPISVSFIPNTDEIILVFSQGELQEGLGPFAIFAPPDFPVYIQVRNWKTGHLLFEAKTSTPVNSAAAFPGGQYLVVSGNYDPTLECQVWEIIKETD